MKAAIVTVGDEILIGQITDTNSGYIAKSLDRIGIGVYEMLSISDDRLHILSTLAFLQNRVDVVIITGGLGPTKDDITKVSLCEYFDDHLVRDEKVEAHIIELFERVTGRVISQVNKDQALVPSKCKVLFNATGTAPGMWLEKGNTVFISLPGVPFEMKGIMDTGVIPHLIERYERPYIIHKTILTYGQGESHIAERIEGWEDSLPDFIKLAYLPNPGRVRLRLSARGSNENALKERLAAETEKLNALIGDIIVGFEEEDVLEVVLGQLLTERGMTIATAESCTGGRIAGMLTSVAGSSAYFKGGTVTYATASKVAVLGIPQELIDRHSVVSAEVAEAMAVAAQQVYNADYAIATTGNAGPSKGDADAEVGTVYIGVATPDTVYSEKYNLGQPREKVIERAANKGLEKIYKELLKN
ncbi:CinA family nicotinamide mononucleotide deamidase-related protein [uncultured Flavobacterium sp.]|uniref:CinA family nicotinamide mononucleotide deamidase-related protein n=1 Tax=uncultured Flavobacterium sp. TaxID=165435 RepID=UPI0025DC9133|nr:CinA family nicotinamide mononucleotide deamidase-related protein [uncultured Flavobacterium sp.]